jgi:3-isopropylmalate dehydrogenase
MRKNIVVIEGDGIGPEVIAQSMKVLDAIAVTYGHEFQYCHALMGAIAIDKTGDPLPDATIQACLNADAVLFGAIGHPKYDNDPNAKVRPEQGLLRIRKVLQLYANIRPVSTYASLQHLSPLKQEKLEGVDMVIYRELTGGIYFGEKNYDATNETASDLCVYRKEEIVRIAQLAFEHAQQRRKKLTLIDKANVLETSRFWRRIVQEMSHDFPDVAVDYMFVDNAAMQLMLNPAQFDIVLTENMFGDILSDEASVISGSLGLLPSASIGKGAALFEPIHGSYPQAAGKDIANPVGSILSAAMMLDHFGMHQEANKIREAVQWTMEHHVVTKDLNPEHYFATSVVGELIADYIENKTCSKTNLDNIRLSQATII